MKSKTTLRTLLYLMLSALLAVSLWGCNNEPDTVGERIEDAADDLADGVEDLADDIGDGVEDLGEDMKEAGEKVKKELEPPAQG